MTTLSQRLRQKLLDLAIRGKLVPQDAHDEPAAELLERMRNEELGMRNGRARRSATAVPISDDEKPFDLPKGWTWCRLGEITTKVGAGSTPKGGKEVYVASGVKFIREQNVYCDGLHNEGMVFIDEATNRRMSGTIVCPGDMLMNITGGSIGRTALVSDDFDIGNVNQHVLIIRAAEPETRKYIHLVLCSPLIVRLMFSRQTGDKPGLSAEKVKAFPIPLPPLAEQKRIVAALDGMLAAADAVEAGTDKIAALKEKARAKILDLAIRGKLVKQDCNDEPASELLARIRNEELEIRSGRARRSATAEPIPDDEKPFDLPKGWAWCRLGEIAYVATGKTPSKTDFVDDGVPYLKMYNLRKQKIDFAFKRQYVKREVHEGQLARSRLAPGDLLMNIVGPPLGKLAIIPESLPEANFNQAAVMIRSYCEIATVNRYLFYYLSQMDEINSIDTKGTAGQDNISLTQAQRMRIALPPLAEQKRIVAKVDEMLAACDGLVGGA